MNYNTITVKDQKIINLQVIQQINQLSLEQKNWVEINDESRGMYSLNSQFRFKISILRPSLFDYSDAYILAKGTITVANTAATEADADNTNRKAILKN